MLAPIAASSNRHIRKPIMPRSFLIQIDPGYRARLSSRGGGGNDSATNRTVKYRARRSEEHTSELQSLMRISYAVFGFKTKNTLSRNSYLHTHHYTTIHKCII